MPGYALCLANALRVAYNTRGDYDKYRHCAVGCALSRYCPNGPALCASAAVLKELLDWVLRKLGYKFTPDWEDIKATMAGCSKGPSLCKTCDEHCKDAGYDPKGPDRK